MPEKTNIDGGLNALLHTVAVARLNTTGWIRVTGDDRVRWLNGMVTNSIQGLAVDEGCYNFVLNAQGRIEGDLTAWMRADAIWLETAAARVGGLIALLGRFIIMDDVELERVPASGLLVAGPDAERLLRDLIAGLALAPGLAAWHGESVWVMRVAAPLVPRFEVWAEDEAALARFANAAEAVDETTLEHLRVLEGVPRYGVDIRDKDLAQETALPDQTSPALHFSKGCYLGQEIVERVRSRGKLHRTLAGFALEGELPAAGTALESNGKQVGELTSVARVVLDGLPVQLGLGIVRREALDGPLQFAGGWARQATLPYRAALARTADTASEIEWMRAGSL